LQKPNLRFLAFLNKAYRTLQFRRFQDSQLTIPKELSLTRRSTMTTMHLTLTSHGYWGSLAMLDESDLEPNKIFPPAAEMHKNNKDTAVLSRDDVSLRSSTVDIIQHAESVLTANDLFLELDLELFLVNICSNSGDIVPKTIIPPPCCSLNMLKQTDDKLLRGNFGKDMSIVSTRLEDTLDMFINSISSCSDE
jgi:hypothetical protein